MSSNSKIILIAIITSLLFGDRPYAVVLGIAQDGGAPHAGCEKSCCTSLLESNKKEKVSCLGIVDPVKKQSWMIDATPDFPSQYRILTEDHGTELMGIFLTHAHVGHYTGLFHLGREVMGMKDMPVYAMPKMKDFLENNGPWNQLVSLGNIEIRTIIESKEIKIGDKNHDKVSGSTLILLTKGEKLKVKGITKAKFLLVSGKPIGEPIARGGPFVMNTKEEILQAVEDYHNGNFVKK